MPFPLVAEESGTVAGRSIVLTVGYRRVGWLGRLLPALLFVTSASVYSFVDEAGPFVAAFAGLALGYAAAPWFVDAVMRPVSLKVTVKGGQVCVARRFRDTERSAQSFERVSGDRFQVAEAKPLFGLRLAPWDAVAYGAYRVKIPLTFRIEAVQLCGLINEYMDTSERGGSV